MSDDRDERPHGLPDDELTDRDTEYSPASERETQELQDEPVDDSAATDDIEASRIANLPGTGGPDDTGDVMPSDIEADEEG
ncbi:hypothetical protein [Gryllotalpicola ginsengisoli]|uniref:hypothetical protein n=1 Tax=Gryllotalpicola ginsengisoli TaxID=444608 RepID=UPI0003B43399|nr:hypothetical protein [Gryllotalpicola ginsengisoli]